MTRRSWIRTLAASWVCARSSTADAGLPVRSFDPGLQRQLEALLQSHNIPGAAITLLRDRRIVQQQGFGVAGDNSPGPVDADTIFQAASLSKPVFALAVMLLAERGQIGLDTPLTRYLPRPYTHEAEPWNPPALIRKVLVDDSRLDKITARMVLQHTTGFPNWARKEPLSFRTDPGTKWGYSSEGYMYLQRAIERIRRESLEQTMRYLVFRPLSMTSSSFVEPQSRKLATGHDKKSAPAATDSFSRPLASTSLYTTARDYGRFLEYVVSSRSPAAPLAAAASRPVAVDQKLGLSWGLGWALEQFGGNQYAFHWGANTGFRAFALASVDGAEGIVLLTNGDNGLNFARDVVQLIFGQRHPLFSFYMLQPD